MNLNFIITFTLENGQLMTQATNQPKFPIYAEKESFFFLKGVDAQIEFVKGGDGTVQKIILYQNGNQQVACIHLGMKSNTKVLYYGSNRIPHRLSIELF